MKHSKDNKILLNSILYATVAALITALFTILFDADRFKDNSSLLMALLSLISVCVASVYAMLFVRRVNPPKYIFLSFAYSDKVIAESIERTLSEQFNKMSKYRFEILTFDSIPYGSDIHETAQKYLEKADIIVVIVSENYITSESCAREFQAIGELGKKIIPIVLTSFEDLSCLPINISNIKALSLADCSSDKELEQQLMHLAKDLIRQRQD